jgi:hypothetical protein
MIAQQQARPQWFQRLLYCDVESKWKNTTLQLFLDSLSAKTEKLSLEGTMDLSRDRLIPEPECCLAVWYNVLHNSAHIELVHTYIVNI